MRKARARGLLAAALAAAIALWAMPARADLAAQQELLPCRTAQADACLRLAERAKGLCIAPDTYVRDFVAESDEIAAALDVFIRGTRVVDRRELGDGACEVDIEITIPELQRELKRIAKEHYRGDNWHERSFDDMQNYQDNEPLAATGYSASRDPGARADLATKTIAPSEPGWTSQHILATGSGGPPEYVTDSGQARLLAERAAEADARRNLLEKIQDIQVDSSTYVRDYAADHDELITRLKAFLQDAMRVDTRHLESGHVEVDVEAPLIGVWNIVKDYATD